MTDATKSTNGAGPANESENQAPIAQIMMNSQYVKDLSFENPNAPQSLLKKDKAPSVHVNIEVNVSSIAQDMYETALTISAESKIEDTPIFVVELVYAGLVTLKSVPDTHRQAVLFIEVPRLLFPFARAILASTTRDGGFPPLMINPIDFAEMFRHHAAEQTQKTVEAKADANADA
ncbi:MAG: protein-export chaperone SecB [Pseudomonadota bacterium]|nr:protein-export chaperone SecB [Pseudomonadota bacterium]